jgi:hypothetical protein
VNLMTASEARVGGTEVPIGGRGGDDEDQVVSLPHVPALRGADNRHSPGHIHAVNPEHGEPVTILPGEMMPGWLLAELERGGTLAVVGPGEFDLVAAPRKGGRK